MIHTTDKIFSFIAAATACCAPIALASDTEGTYPVCLSAAMQTSITERGNGLYAQGTILYKFTQNTLTSIDASDPQNLVELDTIELEPIYLNSLFALDGDIACIINEDGAYSTFLQIIDISDPTNMTLSGTFDLQSLGYKLLIPLKMSISNSIIYTSNVVFDSMPDPDGVLTPDSVLAVDASDPANPILLGEARGTVEYFLQSITGSNGYAYVPGFEYGKPDTGERDYGVGIYDTSTTPYFTLVHFIAGFDQTPAISLRDQKLYVAGNGLHIYDISDPTTPALLNSGNIPVGSERLSFSGNRAVGYREIYNLSNDANPILEHLLQDNSDPDNVIPGFGAENQYPVIIGNTVYFVGDGGIATVNINECDRLCPVDFNTDGSANYYDVAMFIQLYAAQDSAADLNADGNFNFNDVTAFVDIYSNDCP